MARQGAFINGSGGSANWTKGLSDSLSDMSKRFSDQKTAKDTQIFRQQQLANEGVRLGILSDKNAYDMLGGERDAATARQLALTNSATVDKAFGNSQKTASTLAGVHADAASNLAGVNATTASNLAGVNATAAGVQDAHEILTAENLAKVQIAKEERGVQQAQELRAQLLTEQATADQKVRDDRIALTTLANGGENAEVNRIFNLGDIPNRIKLNPRQTSPGNPLRDQSDIDDEQFIASMNQPGNQSLFQDMNKITADTRTRMEAQGYPESDILEAIARNTSQFTGQSDEYKKAALSASEKFTDAQYKVFGSGGGTSSNGILTGGGAGQGEAVSDANFKNDWVEKNNIPTEAGWWATQGNSVNNFNNLDVTQENLSQLSEPLKMLGIKSPAFFAAIESTGTMVDNEWKDLDPKELLMPENKAKFDALVNVGLAIQASHDKANGNMSPAQRSAGNEQVYADGTADIARIFANGQRGNFGKTNLENLYKNAIGYKEPKPGSKLDTPKPDAAGTSEQSGVVEKAAQGVFSSDDTSVPPSQRKSVFTAAPNSSPVSSKTTDELQQEVNALEDSFTIFGNGPKKDKKQVSLLEKEIQQRKDEKLTNEINAELSAMPLEAHMTQAQISYVRSLKKQLAGIGTKTK